MIFLLLLVPYSLSQSMERDFLDASLREAAYRGFLGQVQRLIKEGADPRTVGGDGRTPLHNAALGGHTQVVEFLLREGAEADARDQRETTAIYLAASNCKPRVISVLLKNRADPNIANDRYMTPLMVAAEQSCAIGAELLLRDTRTELGAQDANLKTALDYARESLVVLGDKPQQYIVDLLKHFQEQRDARVQVKR